MGKPRIRILLFWVWVLTATTGLVASNLDMESGMTHFRKNVKWLNAMVRHVRLNDRDFALVQSYEAIDDRCWIYDEALAVMAFTALKQKKVAEKVLDTLGMLMNPDGSFDFSYKISTMQSTSKRQYTGSIAWVAMAINFYRIMTGSNRYNAFLWKILNWIGKQQVMDRDREPYGGVSLGVRDDAFSMEHNLDCFSAFSHYHNDYFQERADKIKRFVLKHLYETDPRPHFLTGYKDNSLYLDCQSWAVLTLGEKYCPVLSFAENRFRVKDGVLGEKHAIQGYFERQAEAAPVWSEGTEGMALAYWLCGMSDKGDYYHAQVKDMMHEGGGIAYATKSRYEFSTSASVAGTVWYIFYEMKLNPFNPSGRTLRSVKSFFRTYKLD